MAKLYDRARMTTATTGVGTITLGAAATGFQTFAAAGVANGDVVRYVIEEGSNWEVGTGTYTTAGTTLTRTPIFSSNANAAITLAGAAQVFITAGAPDIANLGEINTFTAFPQSVGNGTGAPVFRINGAAANNRILRFLTNTSTRWDFIADNAAESGSNAGSNFAIYRYSDAGAFIDIPFQITRSSGLVAIANALSVNGIVNVGTSTVASSLQINGPAASSRLFRFLTASSARWDFSANNVAESGSNAGSDFNIFSYTDAGAFLATPLQIIRSTGQTRVLSILASGTGGIGYTTGAGGTATQITSRTTGVTVNAPNGAITLFSTTTTASTFASFTLTNSTIAATDNVNVSFASAATADRYSVIVTAIAAGSCRIQIHNIAAVTPAEAPVIKFTVIKGANA